MHLFWSADDGLYVMCVSRTPSILNKDPTDKKPKNDKSSVSLKHEFDPTGKRHTFISNLWFLDLDPQSCFYIHLNSVFALRFVLLGLY